MAVLFDLISTNVSVEKPVSDQSLHHIQGIAIPLGPRVQRPALYCFGFYLVCPSVVYLLSITCHLSVIHLSLCHLPTSMSIIYHYLSSTIYHLSIDLSSISSICLLSVRPSMHLPSVDVCLSLTCVSILHLSVPHLLLRIHPSVCPSSSPPPFSVSPGPMGRRIK